MDANYQNPYEAPREVSYAQDEQVSQLAGRLSRLGAALIDGLIQLVIAVPIMIVTGYFARAMQQQVSAAETLLYSMGSFGIFLLLHGYLLATRGQTIGKLAAGVRIVDYHSDKLVPLGKLVGLRLVPIWIASLIPYARGLLPLVDVLFIFGRERRCIHDLIAGTKVIRG